MECWAFWRAAASKAGVSWGDEPEDKSLLGGWLDQRGKSFPKARAFSQILGYHAREALSGEKYSEAVLARQARRGLWPYAG